MKYFKILKIREKKWIHLFQLKLQKISKKAKDAEIAKIRAASDANMSVMKVESDKL